MIYNGHNTLRLCGFPFAEIMSFQPCTAGTTSTRLDFEAHHAVEGAGLSVSTAAASTARRRGRQHGARGVAKLIPFSDCVVMVEG